MPCKILGKLTKIWVRISTSGVVHLTDDIPYSGDISTHAFLKRISGHLSLMGKALPKNITREREDVDDLAESPILILPGKANATEYMDCFFDHLNATYRYLPRGKIKRILDRLYQGDHELLRGDASLALLFSVLGSG
jgi:hypothetical protein